LISPPSNEPAVTAFATLGAHSVRILCWLLAVIGVPLRLRAVG
jgi:hypothetical protein